MAESKVRAGRPHRLAHAAEWEMYLCRRLGSSIKDCGRVFHISIPTVNRIIAKFRWCDERVRNAVREYREKMDAFRPAIVVPKLIKPDSLCASARRRWLRCRALPEWADRRAIRVLYTEARRLTRETGIRHVVDHIYPISSKTICGLHVHTNLQIVTAAFNSAKSNRWEASYE